MAKSNWNLLDYFIPMALVSETNALTDIKGGKVAVNKGANKVVEGFYFDGLTNYIEAKYNFLNDITQSSQDDVNVNIFIYEYVLGDPYIVAGDTVVISGTLSFLFDSTRPRIELAINAATFAQQNPIVIDQKTLHGGIRDNNTTARLYKNGVQVKINPSTASVPPEDKNMLIGGRVATGTNWFNGKLSIVDVGAAIGVDQVAKNDHYRQFLTDLGLTL